MTSGIRAAATSADDPEPTVLTWQKATTALEAIERAVYSMTDLITGTIVERNSVWELAAYPRAQELDRTHLGHQLRQEVIDQGLRLKIAERTDPIRNLVFALAFSQSGLAERASANEHPAP